MNRALLPLVALSSCAAPETPTPEFYECTRQDSLPAHPHAWRYQRLVDAALELGMPAVSVAVRSPEGLWLGAGGEADLSQDIAAETCHRFHIGSVSKIFGATTILRLAQQGALDLDARARDHLPAEVTESIENAEEVTIRQLLSHQTGIPDYVTPAYYLEAFNFSLTPLSARQTLEDWVYGASAHFEPGTDSAYSNSNYLLLSLIIEDVTGQPAYAVMHEEVTAPAGLVDTSGRSEGPAALVRGYAALTSGQLIDHSEATRLIMGEAGKLDGGLVSTPADMVRLLDRLIDGTLLDEAHLTEMLDGDEASDSGSPLMVRYGLGIMELETSWGPALGHYGNVWPYSAVAFHFPDQDTTVAISVSGVVDGYGDLLTTEEAFRDLFEE